MKDFVELTLPPNAGLRDAMRVIDKAAVEFAVVVDADLHVLGTVTDGDIRRAILRNAPLETPVSEVMNSSFTAVTPSESNEDVLNLMQARGFNQIPIVDGERHLLGVHLLRDLLGHKERQNWAIIMAGGEGRRLRPLTDNVPKPMLQVAGRPLLERIVTQLVAAGMKRIFISVGYLADQIEDHFGDGSSFGCAISYLREEEPLGTGGALGLLPETPSHSVLVINGDLHTGVNFGALIDFHAQQGFAATVAVKEFVYQVPYGVVQVDDHCVVEVMEKPTQRYLINAGIYLIEPRLLPLIPSGVKYSLPELLTSARDKGGTVGAFPIREDWIDIGRLEDYEQVIAASMEPLS